MNISRNKSLGVQLGIIMMVILFSSASVISGTSGKYYAPDGIRDTSERLAKRPNHEPLVKLDTDYGNTPLYFIPNKGQFDDRVLYSANAFGYTLWLTSEGMVIDSAGSVQGSSGQMVRDVSRLLFMNADPDPQVIAADLSDYRVNYFIGNNPAGWRANIQTSRAVVYRDLYDGIDLKVYGIGKQIEYDFVVKPGGNVGDIQFRYANIKGTRIDRHGNICINTRRGEFMHRKPHCYQVINGKVREVSGVFQETGNHVFGFRVTGYDDRYELILDPIMELVWSTYIGGSSEDYVSGIALDSSRYSYITGTLQSADFPTVDSYQGAIMGGTDMFVSKLNPTGTDLIFSTFIGGSADDTSRDIAIDSLKNIYITGYTSSLNFPTKNSFQKSTEGKIDVIALKLNSIGSNLTYSTYLGGFNNDKGEGIDVDGAGYAYITGGTASNNFPTKNAFQGGKGCGDNDCFVTKLSTSGKTLVYSTYLGGLGDDYGEDIVVDRGDNAYVTGYTDADNFPTLGSFQPSLASTDVKDAFITKFSVDGKSLIYSSYCGGTGAETAWGIALDSSLNAYLTGQTDSADFPVFSPFQPIVGGGVDAFLVKVNGAGTVRLYSTYLGGTGEDIGYAVAVDNTHAAHVTGTTNSDDFPVTLHNGLFCVPQGSNDIFLTKFFPPGTSLEYSTYLGGSGPEDEPDIALDTLRSVYIAGQTSSGDFPTKHAFQPLLAGSTDSFVTKLYLPAPPTPTPVGTWYTRTPTPTATATFTETLTPTETPLPSVTPRPPGPCHLLIYWDVYHDSDSDTCDGEFPRLCDELADRGHILVENDVPITYSGLMPYDVLIIMDPEVTIDSAEIDAIQMWADQGHGLFIMYENGGANDTDSLDNILAPYSINYLRDSDSELVLDITPHPVTEDVNFIEYNLGAEIDGGTELGFGDAGGLRELCLSVYEDFPRRVVVFGDTDGFKDDALQKYDELTFFLNSLSWLGHCQEPDPSTTLTPTSTPPPTPTCPRSTPREAFGLCSGLNMMSVPYDDSCLSTTRPLLRDICTGGADALWVYDCVSKTFNSFTIIDPGPGWAVYPGMPFWVNITAPGGCNWQTYGTVPVDITYDLCRGLNMVGLPVYSTSIGDASSLLADVPYCTGVFRYQRSVNTSCFFPPGFDSFFTISSPPEDFALFRGYAYWISNSRATTWYPPNP